ncbi:MAG: RDD family protein [Bdellovibrionota bacterium]
MDKEIEQFDPNRFKPMTEGLGLNHFSDGLPYTPTHLKRRPMVQFNFPPPRSPRSSPDASPLPAEEHQTKVQQTTSFETHSPVKQIETESVSAGFLKRIVAFCIDLAFAALIFGVIVWASFSLNGYDVGALMRDRNDSMQMFWPLVLLYVVVHMGYFLIQETTWRRTLGKAILGIRIRSASGFATLGRAVCFFVAAIPFGIGLFWYFFDPKHRCWHDVITDSEVVAG